MIFPTRSHAFRLLLALVLVYISVSLFRGSLNHGVQFREPVILEQPQAIHATVYIPASDSPVIPSLSEWLRQRNIVPGGPVPLITISDSSYLRALRSLQKRLSTWGYEQQLIVLCLDKTCAEDTSLQNAYSGYVQNDANVMHAVGKIKVYFYPSFSYSEGSLPLKQQSSSPILT
jgi:hypothetical protein